jgi:hypothetical protein
MNCNKSDIFRLGSDPQRFSRSLTRHSVLMNAIASRHCRAQPLLADALRDNQHRLWYQNRQDQFMSCKPIGAPVSLFLPMSRQASNRIIAITGKQVRAQFGYSVCPSLAFAKRN